MTLISYTIAFLLIFENFRKLKVIKHLDLIQMNEWNEVSNILIPIKAHFNMQIFRVFIQLSMHSKKDNY